MNDKEIYIAFFLDKGEWGEQLLRYAFEYPITENWGEPEEQAKMKDYFQKAHYTSDRPLVIEKSDIMDFTKYIKEAQS